MEKLKMHSPNLTIANIEKIKTLFPNCVTESTDESGSLKLAVDFDQLRQELSDSIVEGPQERYHLNWPGKREALLTANAPIAKTLRPAIDESVDFENTKNLFIEGDNLEALKLLQETYLGKVKMIYIDPPYNTGNDFVYEDDFAESAEEFLKKSNQKDGAGNRLVANTESNGRFHSDWLSFIYPRLKLARNLLSDDGVIFISIDDNEQANLKRLCDEVFGEGNFVGQITISGNPRGRDYGGIARMHDYLLVYTKSEDVIINNLLDENKEFPHQDNKGGFETRELRNRNIAFNITNRPNLYYPFYINPNSQDENGFYEISLEKQDGWIELLPKESQGIKTVWRWGRERSKQFLNVEIVGKKMQEGWQIVDKYREKTRMARSIWNDKDVNTEKGTLAVKELLNGKYFNFPKPVEMIKRIIEMGSKPNDTILDFFAGSSTTAHAVMQLNAEDGGNRKFIMVQLPEPCNEKSEAFKAGYKNIAEISKERIRLAGKKILEGNCHENWNKDVGFRVLKVDSSNMKDVYYSPNAINQADLLGVVENIKLDRKPEDLLFQVLLDWGVDLSLSITKQNIQGKTVFFVNQNPCDLVACFDKGITEELVKEIAKTKPLRVVFTDIGFVSDSVKINAQQIFKQISPSTDIKAI